MKVDEVIKYIKCDIKNGTKHCTLADCRSCEYDFKLKDKVSFYDVLEEATKIIQQQQAELEQLKSNQPVKCCKCEYKDDCNKGVTHFYRDYTLEMNMQNYNKISYCSYGKRKEREFVLNG